MKKSLQNYVPKVEDSIPRRLACYLFSESLKRPRRIIDLPTIAQAVLMRNRKPSDDSSFVEQVKNAVGGAKRIIQKEFGVTITGVKGRGLRATVDDEDIAGTTYEQKARIVENGIRGLDEVRGLIKANNIADPAKRARVNAISSACRLLTSADIIAKLAAPPKIDDGSNGKT